MAKVLNPRLSELLCTTVEEYIKSAAPIASSTLVGKTKNNACSATIRNDLKTLEQMGYLFQVHTSGGRYPTTMGYSTYIHATPDATFTADVINDLYMLSRLVERIDRKVSGSCEFPIKVVDAEQILKRRQNIYRLLEVPDLEMSALYLIIKERLDGRK